MAEEGMWGVGVGFGGEGLGTERQDMQTSRMAQQLQHCLVDVRRGANKYVFSRSVGISH